MIPQVGDNWRARSAAHTLGEAAGVSRQELGDRKSLKGSKQELGGRKSLKGS